MLILTLRSRGGSPRIFARREQRNNMSAYTETTLRLRLQRADRAAAASTRVCTVEAGVTRVYLTFGELTFCPGKMAVRGKFKLARFRGLLVSPLCHILLWIAWWCWAIYTPLMHTDRIYAFIHHKSSHTSSRTLSASMWEVVPSRLKANLGYLCEIQSYFESPSPTYARQGATPAWSI